MIKSFVAIDLETTGVDASSDKIIEIGAIKVVDGVECDVYSSFVNPKVPVPARITDITGITDSMVCNAPVMAEILDEVLEFIGDLPLLGHNIKFDYSFLKMAALEAGRSFEKTGIDTLKIARVLLPEAESKKLENLCVYFDIDPGSSHRAFDDARSAKILYEKFCDMADGRCKKAAGAMHATGEYMDKLIQLEYSPKKKSPITPAQLRYLKSLVTKYKVSLEILPEQMSKSAASREIDRIISEYGR